MIEVIRQNDKFLPLTVVLRPSPGGRHFGSLGQIGPSVSRNITSDPEDGIGKWNDTQIKAAITKALRPDGTKLAGPMPFDWYAKMTDADLDAIVAYLRTIKPVNQ